MSKKQTPKICREAIRNNWRIFDYIENKTKKLVQLAVNCGLELRYIKNQSLELCLAAVQKNGYALEYVKQQTPEICLAAVQKNGYALEYVKQQTPEICLAAVQQNVYAFEYVLKQTPEICLAAVKHNINAFKIVENPVPVLGMYFDVVDYKDFYNFEFETLYSILKKKNSIPLLCGIGANIMEMYADASYFFEKVIKRMGYNPYDFKFSEEKRTLLIKTDVKFRTVQDRIDYENLCSNLKTGCEWELKKKNIAIYSLRLATLVFIRKNKLYIPPFYPKMLLSSYQFSDPAFMEYAKVD